MKANAKEIFEIIKEVNKRFMQLRPSWLARSRVKVHSSEIGNKFEFQNTYNIVEDALFDMKIDGSLDLFLEPMKPYFIEMYNLWEEIKTYKRTDYIIAYKREIERLQERNDNVGLIGQMIESLQTLLDQFEMPPPKKKGLFLGKLDTFEVINIYRQDVFVIAELFKKWHVFENNDQQEIKIKIDNLNNKVNIENVSDKFLNIPIKYDVFISHASEDKASFVRPFANHLKDNGLKVWYDEFELKIGDSLRRKIDYGLANSRFGIIILSDSFFNKEWPQRELDGLFAREVDNENVILPIWYNVTKKEVLSYSPILLDKVALSTSNFTIEEIAKKISVIVKP